MAAVHKEDNVAHKEENVLDMLSIEAKPLNKSTSMFKPLGLLQC